MPALIFHHLVLEPADNPLGLMNQQIELLNPGGLLEIALPCGNDALLEVYVLNRFCDFDVQVRHPWIFTPASLRHPLRQTGMDFEIRQREGPTVVESAEWPTDERARVRRRCDCRGSRCTWHEHA